MTVALFVVAAVVAVADWVAVDQRLFRLEYLFKPLTIVLLIWAAFTVDLGDAKPFVLAGLAFGAIGAVELLASSDDGPADAPFLAGLGSFLIGHVLYVIGFARAGLQGIFLIAGVLVVAGAAGLTLPAVLRGAARSAGRGFAAVVAAYAGVLGVMAVCAVGTGSWASAAGGVLFLASDTVIAWERFVGRLPRGPLLVIVTYHLAQFLIVLGLVQSL